jgi:hypothetical protein
VIRAEQDLPGNEGGRGKKVGKGGGGRNDSIYAHVNK